MELFQKLTPYISEVDEIYKNAFDYVFANPDIRNIAISGAFGAGKSSVFESYIRKYKEKQKVIRISLAHFGQFKTNEKGEKIVDESELEAKIINQLLHQINPKHIRKTRFTARIQNISWKQWIYLLGIFIASLIPLYIIFGSKVEPIINNLSVRQLKDILLFFRTSDGIFILGITFLIIIFIVLVSLTTQLRGRGLLKSLRVKDFSIELAGNDEESYFDKYLPEIRYLFDNSRSTIVAIDDIDRYFSGSIFEKIRELNTIINFERKKSIRFFYIIKDDIFTSKDRTKFFDFIIPIIPILDSSNSYGYIRSRLLDIFNEIDFDKKFLRGLSIYIDDMRIMKNIVNEFIVYQKLLSEEDLDPNKLLALITYKNIFPKDFNDLQSGSGYLYTLIDSRDEFANECLQEYNEKLELLDSEIEKIKNEFLESIDELSVIFLKPANGLASVSGVNLSNFKTNLEVYKRIKSNPKEAKIYNGNALIDKDYTKDIENLKNNQDYLDRMELVELRQQLNLQKKEQEKREIKNKIDLIHETYLLSNLTNENNIDEFLDRPNKNKKYDHIKSDVHFRIIRFLILDGKIDGNYEDYLTFFKDNELTLLDQKFVRSVIDRKPLPRDHKLTNPQEILERTGGVLENNFAYINKDIFFYVINNKKEEDAGRLIILMKKQMTGVIIREFLNSESDKGFLISMINSHWHTFYSDVVADEPWGQLLKNLYLQLMLIYSSSESIRLIEDTNSISSEINTNRLFLIGINEQEANSVIDNLKEIDAKITKLPELIAEEILFEGIYENNLYELTIENIQYWLNKKYEISENIEGSSLLTKIFSKKDEKLSEYVFDNLGNILSLLFSFYPNLRITDNQQTVWRVLDSEGLDYESKVNYIKRLISPVKDIRNKDDEDILVTLLKNDKVTFNLNNLLTLFTVLNNEFPSEFISYLEKHKRARVEDKSRDSGLFPDSLLRSFFDEVLDNPNLDRMITETLLHATGIKVTEPRNVINQEKAAALIGSGALVMNSANLAFIRSAFPNLLLDFQRKNFNIYLVLLNTIDNIDSQEIVNLLEASMDDGSELRYLINGTEQRRLLSSYRGEVPYKDNYYYPGVKKYIIKHKLNLADLQVIVSDKASLEGNVFQLVKNLIIENTDYVISNKIFIPFKFLDSIITSQLLSYEQKLRIFVNSIDKYIPEQVVKIIYRLDISPFREMFDGKHPNFVFGSENQEILYYLEANKMASKKLNGKLYRKKWN